MDDATVAVKLESYKNFFKTFAETVNINDPLPVRVGSYSLKQHEIQGEVTDWVLQYLQSKNCPVELLPLFVHSILEQVYLCVSEEAAKENGHLRALEPVTFMQMVTSLLNQACLSYLDDSNLQELVNVTRVNPRQQFHPVSIHAIRNGRRKMEDRHVVISDLNAICQLQPVVEDCSYYAIFDGHAGTDAAFYASAQLQQRLVNSPYFPAEPKKAFKEAFLVVDNEFVNGHEDEPIRGGTTAVVCLILGDTLYTAWLGDSQAILVRDGQVISLVNPHKPERPDEQERIASMGGDVIFWEGTFRVNGQLGVSRAIGDASYKPYVTAEPDVVSLALDGTEDFIVLGCDGLWDTVSQQEVAFLVHQHLHHNPGDVEGVSRALVVTAKQKGSLDNISVVVVFLKDPRDFNTRPLPAAPVSEPATPTTPQSNHLFSPLAAFGSTASSAAAGAMDYQNFLQEQRQELDNMAAVYGWNTTPNGSSHPDSVGDDQQWQNSSSLLKQDGNESMESVDSQNWNLSLHTKTDTTSPTPHAAETSPSSHPNPFGLDLTMEGNVSQSFEPDQVDLSSQSTQQHTFDAAPSATSPAANPFDCSDWQTHFEGMMKPALNSSAPSWNEPEGLSKDNPFQYNVTRGNDLEDHSHSEAPNEAELVDASPTETVESVVPGTGSGLNPLAAPFEFAPQQSTTPLLANLRNDNELAVLLAAVNADNEEEEQPETVELEAAGIEGEGESHEASLDPVADPLVEGEGVAGDEVEGDESEDDWSYFKVEPTKTSPSQEDTSEQDVITAQKQVPETSSEVLLATQVPSEETPVSTPGTEQPSPVAQAQFVIEPIVDLAPSVATADHLHIYSSDEPEESLLVLEADPSTAAPSAEEDYSSLQFQTARDSSKPLLSEPSQLEEEQSTLTTPREEADITPERTEVFAADSSFAQNMDYVSDKLSDLQLGTFSPEQQRGVVEQSPPSQVEQRGSFDDIINTPSEPLALAETSVDNIPSPVDFQAPLQDLVDEHRKEFVPESPDNQRDNAQYDQEPTLEIIEPIEDSNMPVLTPEIALPDVVAPSTVQDTPAAETTVEPLMEPVLDAVLESVCDAAVEQVSDEVVKNATEAEATPMRQLVEEENAHTPSATDVLQVEGAEAELLQTPAPHFEPTLAEPAPVPTPAPVQLDEPLETESKPIQSPSAEVLSYDGVIQADETQLSSSDDVVQSPQAEIPSPVAAEESVQESAATTLEESAPEVARVEESALQVVQMEDEVPAAAAAPTATVVDIPKTEMDIRNGNVSPPVSETAATQGSEPEVVSPAVKAKAASPKKSPVAPSAVAKKAPVKAKATAGGSAAAGAKKDDKEAGAGKKEDKPVRPVRLPLVTKAAPAKPKVEAKPKAEPKPAPIRKPVAAAASAVSTTKTSGTTTATTVTKKEVKPVAERVIVKKTTISSTVPRTGTSTTTTTTTTGKPSTTAASRTVTTTRTTVTRVTSAGASASATSTTTVTKSAVNGDVKKPAPKRPVTAPATTKSPVKSSATSTVTKTAPSTAPKPRPVSATASKPPAKTSASNASSKTASPTKPATTSPLKSKTGTTSSPSKAGSAPKPVSKSPTKKATGAAAPAAVPNTEETPVKATTEDAPTEAVDPVPS